MTPVLEAILKTVVYHDLFDRAMTAQEIFLALPVFSDSHGRENLKTSLEEILAALDAPETARFLSEKDGYYFLNGHEKTVALRHERYGLAEAKFKRVRRFFRWARFLPYLRAVFVCNTLARSNARDESDIDVFAVAQPGRLWTTRLLVSGLATLFGTRRSGEHVKDQLCLSFFVTSDALGLEPLAIEDDVYLAHWLAELAPIYDEIGACELLRARNGWARRRLPNALAPSSSRRRALSPAASTIKRALERRLGGKLGDAFERFAKRLQSSWIEEKWKRQERRSTGVVVSDAVLKFHEQDRRAEIRDRYHAALRAHAYAETPAPVRV